MTDEWKPRLHWRITWADDPKKQDYTARADKQSRETIARIYHMISAPDPDRWFWACYDPTASGTVRGTARDAAKIVEDLHFGRQTTAGA